MSLLTGVTGRPVNGRPVGTGRPAGTALRRRRPSAPAAGGPGRTVPPGGGVVRGGALAGTAGPGERRAP